MFWGISQETPLSHYRFCVKKPRKPPKTTYLFFSNCGFLRVCSGGGGNFVLSSSLVGYTTVLGAVAPMVHHGYGFFYRIRDDRWARPSCGFMMYPKLTFSLFKAAF